MLPDMVEDVKLLSHFEIEGWWVWTDWVEEGIASPER